MPPCMVMTNESGQAESPPTRSITGEREARPSTAGQAVMLATHRAVPNFSLLLLQCDDGVTKAACAWSERMGCLNQGTRQTQVLLPGFYSSHMGCESAAPLFLHCWVVHFQHDRTRPRTACFTLPWPAATHAWAGIAGRRRLLRPSCAQPGRATRRLCPVVPQGDGCPPLSQGLAMLHS
jgi:hypothetical protein